MKNFHDIVTACQALAGLFLAIASIVLAMEIFQISDAVQNEIVPSFQDVKAFQRAVEQRSNDVDFGDDTSNWARDGECDDPRFEGPGSALLKLPVDTLRDATDCSMLYEQGEIWLTTGLQ